MLKALGRAFVDELFDYDDYDSRVEWKNYTLYETKMGKFDTLTTKNPTLWGPHIPILPI